MTASYNQGVYSKIDYKVEIVTETEVEIVERKVDEIDKKAMMTVLSLLAAFFSSRPQVNSFNIYSRLRDFRAHTFATISGSYVKFIFGLGGLFNTPSKTKYVLDIGTAYGGECVQKTPMRE